MPLASERIPSPVGWTEDGLAVRLLDQTLLPGQELYLRLESAEEVAEAIRSLRVRGAPAIGITAALGLAVATRRRLEADPGGSMKELTAGFEADLELLMATRPTAVNLAWALRRLGGVFRGMEGEGGEARVTALVREADAIAREDREMCRLIGEHGQSVIPPEGAGVLTHCNAGALATGGIGTALAPIYLAAERGIPLEVFADETRPVLQGARLTAWELGKAGLDVTVIPDSSAAALLRTGRVNLVLVGADRVAANGDVANKIGTYGLAVTARHHGIPFYVALPRSTFDSALPGGEWIPIEERDPSEVAEVAGRRIVPEDGRAWNPAFDVTPSHLVTAFITDGGILRPPFEVSIAGLLDSPPGGEGRVSSPDSDSPSRAQEEP
jgi:methylthioribose-1-phosphate isomerase